MAKDGNIRWPFESRSGYPRPEWCIEQSYRAGQGQDSWLKGMSEDKRLEWAAVPISAGRMAPMISATPAQTGVRTYGQSMIRPRQ